MYEFMGQIQKIFGNSFQPLAMTKFLSLL